MKSLTNVSRQIAAFVIIVLASFAFTGLCLYGMGLGRVASFFVSTLLCAVVTILLNPPMPKWLQQ